MLQWVKVKDDEGKVITVFERSKWMDFIEDVGLTRALIDSGYRSPKTFVKERHMDSWLAYQVIKRMEN